MLPGYTKIVAEVQRDEALTMKHRRQWHKEQAETLRRSYGGPHLGFSRRLRVRAGRRLAVRATRD